MLASSHLTWSSRLVLRDAVPSPLNLHDPLRDHLQSALGSAFALERELGGGGMSRVFLAEERALGRRVVIKMLPPELSSEINAERFKREVRLAAQLQHPHIVPLLMAGEAGGLLYYTMPFVEGESLRTRLERERELPIGEAVKILRDVADALAYAHERGIVHRDIKPGNILLDRQHAVVTDFGVAKALAAASRGDTDATLTSSGVVLGTPVYMAPEQALCDPATDHRADLYALGAVAYEMLAGAPPFTGPSWQAVLAAHARQSPEPVSDRRKSLPAPLARLTMRLLEKEPADRPQSAEEVVRELEAVAASASSGMLAPRPRAQHRALWVASGVLALAAVGASVLWRGAHASQGRDASAPLVALPPSVLKSVAVLPFVSLSAERETDYFSDGMTEELIDALARVPELQVAARTSSFAFKGKSLSVRTIGDSLRVGALVEGSVRRAGLHLRVAAQLIDVPTGYHLWSETYDRQLKDVFRVQDELARAIVAALKTNLSAHENFTLVRQATRSTTAHDLYLQGRYFRNQRTQSALRTAARYFERAIAQDSSYAEAFAALAFAYSNFGAFEVSSPREAYPKAKAAAERALELDSTLAEAHLALGQLLRFQWNWAGAEREFRRAIELNPSDASAYQLYGTSLSWLGRHMEAIAVTDHAVALDPLSRIINVWKGNVLYRSRRNDEAIAQLRRTLELDPDYVYTHMNLGQAYLAKGMHSEAVAELETAARPPGPGYVQGILAHAYAVSGRRDLALAIVQNLTQRARHAYVSPVDFAYAYVGLGETDRAVAELDKAAEAHDSLLIFALTDPVFDPLRSDPRFTALRRKAGLPCGPSC